MVICARLIDVQTRAEGVSVREKGGSQCRSSKPDASSSATLQWPARPASCTSHEWRPQRGPPSKQPLARVVKVPGAICVAPQNLSEELLRAEGFTDVRYVDGWPTGEYAAQVGKGEADFSRRSRIIALRL
jgi:hypothetical protein